MADIEHLLLGAAVLLLLAVLAEGVAKRAGMPPLLLFLALGMLAGSDGPGGIYFDNAWLAQLVGTLALSAILFAAGLETDWRQVRAVLWPALSLSTAGVLLTTALVGIFASLTLGFSWTDGLLLGAIVSPTDAAAVFSVIAASRVRLGGRVQSLLELESGTNDPMAVFLTIGLTELVIAPQTSPWSLALLFIQQMGLGAVIGAGLGLGMAWVIKWLRQRGADEPSPVLTIALALLTYALAASLGGSGFLAVYLAGIILGHRSLGQRAASAPPAAQQPTGHTPSLSATAPTATTVSEQARLVGFHAGLAALMEIGMFLTLGLLVFPSRLLPVSGQGLLVTLFLVVVARPVSVFVSLAGSRFRVREQIFVAWVGLRGAVPIVLATFPLLAGAPRAGLLFDLVFFLVLVSVLAQGTTIALAARWLKVAASP